MNKWDKRELDEAREHLNKLKAERYQEDVRIEMQLFIHKLAQHNRRVIEALEKQNKSNNNTNT